MKVFICGFSGAGKSYLLKQLEFSGKLSGYQFIDLDFQIDQKYATQFDSLAQFIENIGIEKFRELEKSEISKFVAYERIILSLGGGALTPQTKELLTDEWQGVWLNTDFATCFERIKGDESRYLSQFSKKELEVIYQQRCRDYELYPSISHVSQVIELTKR